MEHPSVAGDACSFAEFLERIRRGDELAAAELVRRDEPAIRRQARLRMVDSRLRRTFDSTDICQSVLASFFVQAAAGQFDLERSEDLLRLLVTMVRKEVALGARKQAAGRRDLRRVVSIDVGEQDVADASPSPSRILAGREHLDEFRRRLTAEERRLADLRAQGCNWAQIATELGGTPQARRKQLARAADRIARELGLEAADRESGPR